MYRIGIDLGGTNIAAAIVNNDFKIVKKMSVPTGKEREAGLIMDDMAELCRNCLSGNYNEACKLHYRLFDIFKDVFLETNPIPVKKAMYMMGLAEDEIRLPLISMSATNTQTLKSVMQDLGVKIING